MKNIFQVLVSLLLFSMISFNSKAQSKLDTLQFEVKGVCGMCKERIENSAYVKGVKLAEWDKTTHQLSVIYRTDKITEEAIHKAVIVSGHDTQKHEASEEAYAKLPHCCAYRDGVETH